jgi:Flp pilus assembly protein TadG
MKRRHGSDGQALVEFALIAPLLFILLFGILQFGFTFGGQIVLSNAAREAARYASTYPLSPGGIQGPVQAQVNAYLGPNLPANNGGAVATATYCWFTNPGTPTTYSYKVRVGVTYGHTLFVPLVGQFVDGIDGVNDNRFTTGVNEEMRVETPPVTVVAAGVTQPCP